MFCDLLNKTLQSNQNRIFLNIRNSKTSDKQHPMRLSKRVSNTNTKGVHKRQAQGKAGVVPKEVINKYRFI